MRADRLPILFFSLMCLVLGPSNKAFATDQTFPVELRSEHDSVQHEKNESDEDEQAEVKREVQGGNAVSLQKLIEKLNADYPGQVLDVQLKRQEDRLLFVVKYIDGDGLIKTITLDAQTLERI